MEFFKNLFRPKTKLQALAKVDITKRFDLIGRVGQGSMSKVWRARDTKTGKTVALKLLDKEKTKRLEARFPGLNKPPEGEIATSLKHPNIVQTYEYGMATTGEPFLVMEFVEGLGLSYLIDVQNDVMKKHRVRLMIELAEAISFFHRQNSIHRDICPRNVLVDQEHHIKLIDFGLVVPNTAAFQAPGNRTGTANYMAPELIKRQKTDQRLDIFSYAVTCYEMYTRRYPWGAGETLEMALQHINSPPVDLRELVPGIDEQIAAAIMKGLERDPNDRWKFIDNMANEFRDAEERIDNEQIERELSAQPSMTTAPKAPAVKQPVPTAQKPKVKKPESQERA